MFKSPAPHHQFPRVNFQVLTVPVKYPQKNVHLQIISRLKNGFQISQNSGPQRVTKKTSFHHSFQQNSPTNRAFCHKYLRRMRAQMWCPVAFKTIFHRDFVICAASFFSKTFLHIGLSRGREEKMDQAWLVFMVFISVEIPKHQQ